MRLFKNIAIVVCVFFLLGLGSMHMWSHPAFLMLIVGFISLGYRKLNRCTIKRRYTS
jgi:hypothetical protein